MEKAPVIGAPAPGGQVSDAQCLAYTGLYLLQDKPDEALKLARAGKPDTQLKAYALCAEWSSDPSAALTSAVTLVAGLAKAKGKEAGLPQPVVLRLSQRAAEAGKADDAKALADALTDEGLRAWARGDAIRLRLASASKEPADEAAAEVPDDPRNLRAGHAWGRLAVARQNARLSGARDDKPIADWPRSVRPFGLAGIALGLQDRDVGP